MVRVVFLHPDLGIGGAERLVVDAAVALRSRGCQVQIWTAHYDPTHCFSETLDSDLPVVCVGDWLPRSVCGYFHALCAYLRMIYVALYLLLFSREEFDVVFCDQVRSYTFTHTHASSWVWCLIYLQYKVSNNLYAVSLYLFH